MISMFLDGFLTYPLIAKAFEGIKVGVGILILDTGFTMMKKMHKKPQPRIIAGCGFVDMLLINISVKFSSIALLLITHRQACRWVCFFY